MKKGKFSRFLALLLAAVMLLGAAPLAIAAEEDTNSDDQVSTIGLTMGTKPTDGTTTGSPFPQGTAGSNSFRIPAMVTLSDGTIVAAADARWNTTYDGGGLDTIVARSSDSGASWNYTFANYLGDNGNVYNGSGSTCFIDPALAVTSNDTIYMLCDLYPYGVALNGSGHTPPSTSVGFADDGCLLLCKDGESSYNYHLDLDTYKLYKNYVEVTGYTVDEHFNITWTENGEAKTSNLFFSDSPFKVVRTGYLYLTKSTDKGATWSAPTLLKLKTSSEQVCLVGPGRGLVTSSGMIVFPVYSYNGSAGSQKMGFIYSTDGVNWNRSADFTGATWSSESAVVELTDGTLRFFYRNGTQTLCYVDYSNGSWGTQVSTGVATNSNTQLSAITYSKTIDGKQVILVSCPTGPNGNGSDQSEAGYRQNGKIFVFTVEGDKTLKLANSVAVTSKNSANSFMYSCLTELKDSSVAILYEDNESAWGTGDTCYYQMSYATYAASELGVSFDSGSTEAPSETATVPDSTSGITVTAAGLTGLSVQQASAPTIDDATRIKAYDIIPSTAGGNYTGSATVSIPLPSGWNPDCVKGFVVNSDGTVTSIDASCTNNTVSFNVPHFSTIGIYEVQAADSETTGEVVSITLDVDGTYTTKSFDGEVTAPTDEEGVVTTQANVTSGITEKYALATIGDGTFYVSTSSDGTGPFVPLYIQQIETNNYGFWSTTYYCLKKSSSDSGYIYPNVSFNWNNNPKYTYSLEENSSYHGDIKIEPDDPGYRFYHRGYDKKSYLTLNAFSTDFDATSTATTLYLYTKTSESTPASTTFTFTGVKPGYTEVVIDGVTYKITVNKVKDSATISVGGNATFSKAGTTIESNTNSSIASATLNNGTLTVTGLKAGTTTITTDYGVYTITVNDGEAVSIKVGETMTIGGDITLTDGQYVKWDSADSHYVGVAGNYDSTKGAYTNTATIVGNNVTDTDSPVVVTGTVYNADGSLAATHKWLVTVTENSTTGGTGTRTIYINVERIEHCDVYYSINGGELIKVNGTGILVDKEVHAPELFNIMYFAAPEEGYALTYMGATNTANQFYSLNGNNPDGTDSDAWPFKSQNPASIPTDDKSSDWKSGHGFRWALIQGNMSIAQMKVLFSNAIALGCDGATTQTVNNTDNNGGKLNVNMSFVAEKLPEMYKRLTGITHEGMYKPYTDGMTVELGDTLHYTIYVAVPMNAYDGSGEINYTTVSIADDKTGSEWTADKVNNVNPETSFTWSVNGGTSKEIYCTSYSNETAYWNAIKSTAKADGSVDYFTVTSFTTKDNSGNEYTYSGSSSYVYAFHTDLTLSAANYTNVVDENGYVVNNATGKHTFEATYTEGTYTTNSKSSAKVQLAAEEYVIDFGLPVTIDLSSKLNNATISTVENVTFGSVTNNGNGTVTYTPNKVLTDVDYFYIDCGTDLKIPIRIVPASNVLYEDNFLSVNTTKGTTYANWTEIPSAISGTQFTDQTTQYGYDNAYADSTGNSMGSAWTITGLESGKGSKYLTTSFTGTGFDLIGTAGPDTGYVYLVIQGATNRMVIIDTSYVGGDGKTTLHQVPLAHIDLTEGTYTVNIRAAYRAASTSGTSAASVYGMDSSDPMEDVYAVLGELYADGFQFDDIEVIGFNGTSAASTYSNSSTVDVSNRPEGTTVTIDGFRVYRSSNNDAYSANEKGVVYYNALGELTENNITAYTESGNGTYDKTQYEANGGAENEIYLAPGQSVAFNVGSATAVQVSLRSVNGTPISVNATTIAHATEMYYTVEPTNGKVTITNGSTNSTLLGIGNIKVLGNATVAAISEEDAPAVYALLRSGGSRIAAYDVDDSTQEPEIPAYEPFVKVDVKSVNVIRNKLVTVTITTSTDVKTLTINGKTLKPTNSWLVKMGWSDTYTYVYVDTVKRGTTRDYEIIATNSDGLCCTYSTQG